ncbi:vacuolar protein sorting-associated protein 62 [Tanacetum coccineum]
MSSLRLCRLAVHMLSTILILQIVCSAYRPYNDLNNAEEKALSFDYPEGGYFAHETTDLGELEGFRAKYFKKDVYSGRPSIEQIKSMISAYAPLIYFHPHEEYFPSSVSWFFKSGAQIFDPKPHMITNDAKLQVGSFAVLLGKAGEHVSDWEHMRLRIDNVSGKLTSVYLSQHTKGKWLQANEFEYLNGRPVVYASLHGHALYNAPVKTIHYNAKDLLDATEKQMLIREFKSVYPRKS